MGNFGSLFLCGNVFRVCRNVNYSVCMSYLLRQPAVDLFGEVAITDSDIWDWVAAVSPIHLDDRGFDLYVKNFDVAGKVARAKLQGRFEAITAHKPRPYHARLDMLRIA